MRIYPITGVLVNRPYKVLFSITEFSDGKQFPDYVTFCPRDDLFEELNRSNQVGDIITQFPQIKTFAITTSHLKGIIDVYHIRIALSILYTTHILYESSDFRMFDDEKIYGVNPFFCDARVGSQHYNGNDFAFTLPYYDLDPADDHHRRSVYVESDLIIKEKMPKKNNEIYKELKKEKIPFDSFENSLAAVNSLIASSHPLRDRFMSAFNFVYYILPQTDLTLAAVNYSTILEALLIKGKKDPKKGSVAFRSACLVENMSSKDDKQRLATLIANMYVLRSDVVHDGQFVFEIDNNNYLSFDYVRRVIFLLFERFITLNIKEQKDIKTIVERNIKLDGLASGVDYILTNEDDVHTDDE